MISIFDINFWSEVWNSLKKNKLRTVLTAFGVFWGIFMLVIMAGAGQGLENTVKKGFEDFATNSAFVWSNRTAEPYKGFKQGRRWSIDNRDIEYLKEKVSGIDKIAPRLTRRGGGNNTIRNDRGGSFYIKGDYPVYLEIDPADIAEGRYINELDIKMRRKVCVIGERVRDEMFKRGEDPIGEHLKVNGIYYQVVGIMIPITDMNIGGDKRESITIPFTTMQQAYNYGARVNFFAVTASRGIAVSSVEDEVIAILKSNHDIAPKDDNAVGHFNLEKQVKKIQGLFIGIKVLTWLVGIGTLFAGIIGVSNIMLVIVKERTHEMGIQKALGATPAKVLMQILTESTVLTVFAGYIGLSLGMGILEMVSNVLAKAAEDPNANVALTNPQVDLSTALWALLILSIGGLIAGLLPAKRAMKMKTIDAIRQE